MHDRTKPLAHVHALLLCISLLHACAEGGSESAPSGAQPFGQVAPGTGADALAATGGMAGAAAPTEPGAAPGASGDAVTPGDSAPTMDDGPTMAEPARAPTAGAIPPIGPLAEWPAIAEAEGFGFDEGTYTIPPGTEGYVCARIQLPERYRAEDLAIWGWDVDLPEGTHHFFMTYDPRPFPGAPGEAIAPCVDSKGFWIDVTDDPNGGSVTQFLDGGGKILLGEGVGMRHWENGEEELLHGSYMAAGGHLVTNHHVVNLGTEPIEVHGRMNLYVKPASEVPYVTQMVNCLANAIDIPPGGTQVVDGICTAPFDMDITTLASHAHQFLERFELRLYRGGIGGGVQDEVIYTSSDWDSPNIVPQVPPIRLAAGDGLAFRCYYNNFSDQRVSYQFAGEYSEMCAFMGAYAYPATPENVGKVPPNLGAILGNPLPGLMLDTAIVPGPF